jgi:predicted DNA-binding transcriptional regulator YafY
MSEAVSIHYTNHRGETAVRRILPRSMWHGSTQWHPQPQWLMRAFDLDKREVRDFAMAGISKWADEALSQ